MATRGLRFGSHHEYLVDTAGSFNTNKKWTLNSNNEVVELADVELGGSNEQQFLSSGSAAGYGGGGDECGRLMRYNSAPSSLFSDLDQIPRSSSCSTATINCSKLQGSRAAAAGGGAGLFGGVDILPPLPVLHHHHATSTRYSQSSEAVGLVGQVAGGGGGSFTTLLVGGGSETSSGSGLVRQNSTPASMLSRLDLEPQQQQQRQHQQQQAGSGVGGTHSSEEESPLLGSPNDAALSTEDVTGMDMGGDAAFWEDSHFARKRLRDVDMSLAGEMDNVNHQQQHTLTRHMSLPVTTSSTERSPTRVVANGDNLLQDSVPCRLRAKRGCATHPRSIAERIRRTKISERMRKLQELVPNMDKQTNTSDMLDEAVEYMKYLKQRVEELSDCLEKCQGLCKASTNKNGNNRTQ